MEGTAYDNGSAACNGDDGDGIHGKLTFSGKPQRRETTLSPSPGCEGWGPKTSGEGRRGRCDRDGRDDLENALSPAPQNYR